MLPKSVSSLDLKDQARFQEADTNKHRPIGWWEPNHMCVGLVQVWLFILGGKLAKSVKTDPGGDLIPDGDFGQETFDAVMAFQKENGMKPDGLVGHDTLDMINQRLPRRRLKPPTTHNSNVIIRKRRCPPGTLICPEP